MPLLKEIVEVLEKAVPAALAADWDNPGLQIGDPAAQVKKALVALDPLPRVIDEARAMGAGLLVTPHPLFFGAVRSLAPSRGHGAAVRAAIEGGVAVYSIHTNYDRISPGVSDVLADVLGLRDVRPLERAEGWPERYGFGRVGDLPAKRKVVELMLGLRDELKAGGVRLSGEPDRTVSRVAVCGGSGSELIGKAAAAGAELFVTGDIKYHGALEALELGMAVLDVGHFASENYAVPALAERIAGALRESGLELDIKISMTQGE